MLTSPPQINLPLFFLYHIGPSCILVVTETVHSHVVMFALYSFLFVWQSCMWAWYCEVWRQRLRAGYWWYRLEGSGKRNKGSARCKHTCMFWSVAHLVLFLGFFTFMPIEVFSVKAISSYWTVNGLKTYCWRRKWHSISEAFQKHLSSHVVADKYLERPFTLASTLHSRQDYEEHLMQYLDFQVSAYTRRPL